MKKCFVVAWLIIVVISCNKAVDNSSQLPVIEIGKSFGSKKAPVKLSQYASDIDYIVLETLPESLISEASFTSISKTSIGYVVHDHNQTYSSPLLFAFDGSFAGAMGSIGRAYNEIVRVHKVMVNDHTDEIVVADNDKLLFYGLTGNWKRTMDVFHNTLRFRVFCIGENDYVYLKPPGLEECHVKKEHLVFFDSLGKTLKKIELDKKSCQTRNIHNIDGGDRTVVGCKLFNSSKGIVMQSYDDIIYRLKSVDADQEPLQPIYKLDFGEYASGESVGAGLWKSDAGFIETDKFITLTALFPLSEFPEIDANYRFSRFVYDKQSCNTYCLPYYDDCGYAGFENDIDGGIPFFPLHHKDGKAYQFVDASVFIEMAEKSSSEKMKRVASSLTEESNPVLIEVALK